MEKTMKSLMLYAGCAVKGAPKKFLADFEKLNKKIEAMEIELKGETITVEVLRFKIKKPEDTFDVYQIDIQEHVMACDMMLAVCDYPSTGLGYEIATMVELHHKPLLAVAHENADVSSLILAVESHNTGFTFARYKNLLADVPDLLRQTVEKHGLYLRSSIK